KRRAGHLGDAGRHAAGTRRDPSTTERTATTPPRGARTVGVARLVATESAVVELAARWQSLTWSRSDGGSRWGSLALVGIPPPLVRARACGPRRWSGDEARGSRDCPCFPCPHRHRDNASRNQ